MPVDFIIPSQHLQLSLTQIFHQPVVLQAEDFAHSQKTFFADFGVGQHQGRLLDVADFFGQYGVAGEQEVAVVEAPQPLLRQALRQAQGPLSTSLGL